jgi:hypothetical protein
MTPKNVPALEASVIQPRSAFTLWNAQQQLERIDRQLNNLNGEKADAGGTAQSSHDVFAGLSPAERAIWEEKARVDLERYHVEREGKGLLPDPTVLVAPSTVAPPRTAADYRMSDFPVASPSSSEDWRTGLSPSRFAAMSMAAADQARYDSEAAAIQETAQSGLFLFGPGVAQAALQRAREVNAFRAELAAITGDPIPDDPTLRVKLHTVLLQHLLATYSLANGLHAKTLELLEFAILRHACQLLLQAHRGESRVPPADAASSSSLLAFSSSNPRVTIGPHNIYPDASVAHQVDHLRQQAITKLRFAGFEKNTIFPLEIVKRWYREFAMQIYPEAVRPSFWSRRRWSRWRTSSRSS